jgi:hypothetical protein
MQRALEIKLLHSPHSHHKRALRCNACTCQVYGKLMEVVAVTPTAKSVMQLRVVIGKHADIDPADVDNALAKLRSCLRGDSPDLFRYDALDHITKLITNVCCVMSASKGLREPELVQDCTDAVRSLDAYNEFVRSNASRFKDLASPTFPVVPDAIDQVLAWTDACFDTVDIVWVCRAFAIDCVQFVEAEDRPGNIYGFSDQVKCREFNPTRPGPSHSGAPGVVPSPHLPPVPGGTGRGPGVIPQPPPPSPPRTPLLSLGAVNRWHCQADGLRDDVDVLQGMLPAMSVLEDPSLLERNVADPVLEADSVAVVDRLNSTTEQTARAKKLVRLGLSLPVLRCEYESAKKVQHWAKMACGVDHALAVLSTREHWISPREKSAFVERLMQELNKFPLPAWLVDVLESLLESDAARGGK